jgi:CRP-like cAMP-binding protein
MDLSNIMKQVALFRGLNEEQRKLVGAISHEEQHDSGSVIVRQGDEGDAFYVIGRGQVVVQVRSSRGESFDALYLGEGQVFGEMALVDQGTRSASIVAIDANTAVYRIGTKDFTDLCQSNTAIGYVMMRNIAQDLSFKLRHRDFDPKSS